MANTPADHFIGRTWTQRIEQLLHPQAGQQAGVGPIGAKNSGGGSQSEGPKNADGPLLENRRATDGEKVQRRVMDLSDFNNIVVSSEERQILMGKVQRGKRLTNEEVMRVCAMLMQIIQQDDKARSDATMFLAALSARYGIEIKAD